jgi:hypothetical protein
LFLCCMDLAGARMSEKRGGRVLFSIPGFVFFPAHPSRQGVVQLMKLGQSAAKLRRCALRLDRRRSRLVPELVKCALEAEQVLEEDEVVLFEPSEEVRFNDGELKTPTKTVDAREMPPARKKKTLRTGTHHKNKDLHVEDQTFRRFRERARQQRK